MSVTHNHNGNSPAIIFDYGNVLLSWDPRALYRKLLDDDAAIEKFLNDVHFFEWNRVNDASPSLEKNVADLCAEFPHYSDLIRAYDLRYEDSLVGPIEPVVSILGALKQSGYRLYGLSNWPGNKFSLVRGHYPFFEWLDDMVISGEVGVAKPDPRIFDLLLAKIGRPAVECLLIDDSLTNVEAARRLGFQTIHYQSPIQLQADLEHQLGVSLKVPLS